MTYLNMNHYIWAEWAWNQFIYIFQAMQKSLDKNIICVEIPELNKCVSQHVP